MMKTYYSLPIPPYPEFPQKTGRQVVDEIVAFLQKQIASERKNLKPEPHPLDFSLATVEEEQSQRYNIELHNTRIHAIIAHNEWMIEALINTYIKIPESKVFKDYANFI